MSVIWKSFTSAMDSSLGSDKEGEYSDTYSTGNESLNDKGSIKKG